jgi:hypothetical protein
MPKGFEETFLAKWLPTDGLDATPATLEAVSGPGWTRASDLRKIAPSAFQPRRIPSMPCCPRRRRCGSRLRSAGFEESVSAANVLHLRTPEA